MRREHLEAQNCALLSLRAGDLAQLGMRPLLLREAADRLDAADVEGMR